MQFDVTESRGGNLEGQGSSVCNSIDFMLECSVVYSRATEMTSGGIMVTLPKSIYFYIIYIYYLVSVHICQNRNGLEKLKLMYKYMKKFKLQLGKYYFNLYPPICCFHG